MYTSISLVDSKRTRRWSSSGQNTIMTMNLFVFVTDSDHRPLHPLLLIDDPTNVTLRVSTRNRRACRLLVPSLWVNMCLKPLSASVWGAMDGLTSMAFVVVLDNPTTLVLTTAVVVDDPTCLQLPSSWLLTCRLVHTTAILVDEPHHLVHACTF